MDRRNLTTAAIVVTAGLLLYGGVALAREQQAGDDRGARIIAPAVNAKDDRPAATASPELVPSAAADDKGGLRMGSDDTAKPTASPDDKGGLRSGSDDKAKPTASPDDKGGRRKASDDKARPTASPDDKGGSGGGSDDKAAPTASPDDHGGHGSDGGGHGSDD